MGYEIGRKIGPPLFHREGRFLNTTNFDKTHDFFERYGNKALVLGRFVPIVRTFITVIAGAGEMNRRRFFGWSFVGAVLWATGLTLLGYFLGEAVPGAQRPPRAGGAADRRRCRCCRWSTSSGSTGARRVVRLRRSPTT